MTEEETTFFDLNDEKLVYVIDPEEGGAGLASTQSNNKNELSEEKLDTMESRGFGEKLFEETAINTDWAAARVKDETSSIAVEYILAGVSVGDITEEVIPETVDKEELKRLVSQGELMELPNSQKLSILMTEIQEGLNDCYKRNQ